MVYFVATPIGNLGDISFRAIEVLKSVDVIACEDTRTSQTLLRHYHIEKPLLSHHKHNEKSSTEGLIALIKEGKNIAIISDSGMPVISDPGETLAKRLKEENIAFTVIPGANAALCALVLSGLSASQFCFVGFLPEKKKDRASLLSHISTWKATLLFHLSPHSLEEDLQNLFDILGARKACLVKEISKMHEQSHSFVLGEKVVVDERGEFVLVVEGARESAALNLEEQVKEEISLLVEFGMSPSSAVKYVAKKFDLSKNEVYVIAHEKA